MSSNTILEKSAIRQIAQELATLQADTYILLVKTQNFHWNIIDPRFMSLHLFFEGQYDELAENIDVIAERIRSLGERALGSMREYLEFTRLEESKSTLTGDEMLKALLHDHESIIQWLRSSIEQVQKLGDEGTADLFINRLRAHEKMAWMIRSHLN